MKFQKVVLFCAFLFCFNNLFGQAFLEGYVKDATTKAPLTFATIQYAPGKGVLTNESGYFRIPFHLDISTIQVTYVGYESTKTPVTLSESFYEILLEQTAIPLQEITVLGTDLYAANLFFKSISRSRKDAKYRQLAKTFRRTYSYRDGLPSEHMEAFYNARTRAGGLDYLKLKNGRYGVPSDTSFINMQMTQILERYKLFTNEYEFLPKSPLGYSSVKKLRKDFDIRISNSFAVEQDTIWEFTFLPVNDPRSLFAGKAWVRNSNLIIEKVELGIKNTSRNPFIIVPDPELNSIESLDFNLIIGFKYEKNKTVFDYLHFTYNMDVTTPLDTFNVISNNNFYFYEYQKEFTLPFFPLFADRFHDYEKILFFPYDNRFWEKNYLIAETEDEQLFREQLEERQLFKNQSGEQSALIQRRFEPWSEDWQIEPQLVADRELWENRKVDEIVYINRIGVPLDYSLFAKTFIFLDYECSSDTILFRTEAIIDYRFCFSIERTMKDFNYLEDFLHLTKIHACYLQQELAKEFGSDKNCPDRNILKIRLNQADRKLKKAIKNYNDNIHALNDEERASLSKKIKIQLEKAIKTLQ